MQATCSTCQTPFEITDQELALLKKISPQIAGQTFDLPPPKECFDCRLRRRLAYYNCRSLYRRTCDFSQKPIVSIYSPDKPFKVYEKEIWYSDQWDPLQYGREFDFNRPFFDQFHELDAVVPRMSLAQLGYNQNSEFTNDNYKLKNCYLVFDGEQAEDCCYGQSFVNVKSSFDFIFLDKCELCYECCHCADGYNLRYCAFSKNCSDSWFLRDCIGCRNCFGCANLRQKQFCIFNEQKTEAEYKAFMAAFASGTHSQLQSMRTKMQTFFLSQPVKATRGEQNIDCVGDNIDNCKSAYHCFDNWSLQDCLHCTDCLVGAKDCADIHIWGNAMELCYNSCVIGDKIRNVVAGYYVLEGCSNIFYSTYCSRSVHNLFGCVGLRHKEYCILNKQYSQAEYEQLVPKIITHMQQTGEWGQFFPPEISAFGYNETMAQTVFPASKEDIQAKGWQWSDYEAPVEAKQSIPASRLPDDIAQIPDDILEWAIECEVTGRPFKLIKQELEFYRQHALPVPRRHPDQRHADRYALKNPYRLWSRTCAKCGTAIQTPYHPDRPETVLCEECYKAAVY